MPEHELMTRLDFIAFSLPSVSLRAEFLQEMWPIMFCLSCAQHEALTVRENAFRALSQMCEYGTPLALRISSNTT